MPEASVDVYGQAAGWKHDVWSSANVRHSHRVIDTEAHTASMKLRSDREFGFGVPTTIRAHHPRSSRT